VVASKKLDRQIVVFKVENREYGVEISRVNQIITPPKVFKLPEAPSYIEGLINLRGTIYTLISLRTKLGLPFKEIDESSRIIIFDEIGIKVGLLTDEANDIVTINESELMETVKSLSLEEEKFIREVVKKGDRTLFILDIEKLLSA